MAVGIALTFIDKMFFTVHMLCNCINEWLS